MAKLFGFSIDDSDDKLKSKSIVSPVPPNNDDGVDNFISSGFYGQYLDIEGVYRTEFDLIKRYREMALHPECDNAIEDVVNEAIVSDLYDSPVEIELSNLNASDKLKDKIREEFRYIKELLDFDRKSHEIFRNWYVDGKLYYLKVIDIKKPQDGIQDLRYIDPMKMKYVRQEKKRNNKNFINVNAIQETDKVFFPEVEEFYMYSPTSQYASGSFSSGGAQKQIKIAKDSITYVTSGLVDRNKGTILSYLHKSIKALNQLRMIEDSLVIYRLSRAPERRIFYIDVGNLPKAKAEQYLKEVMSRYRNKLVYDACLSMDTRIPLLNGQTLTLSEITDKFNKGERLWTYSCDPNTGKFAPGLISWSGVTRKNEKVMKITLDNDKTIVCTLDHKFPVWNRGKVEAKDLQIGDSMIPFYSKLKQLSSASKNSTYEQIYENESKKWIYVHRLVSRWKDELNLSNEYNYSPQRLDEDKKTSIVYKNHKIKNIEFLEESIDVGTLTIDKDEIYHNYHTFALDSGIYTCNSTGEVRDDKKFMSMMEDFWLPRREGGRGTEITTLPGGQNLGELSDIEYFQKKLYRALGVPESRITGSGDGFNLGRSSEILRDELKFSKFVGRLRKRFSNLFNDMLKTQLVLKNIVTPEDWDSMSDHIQYDYLYDNQFSELKDSELMTERLGILATIEPYIGKYYSSAYIRKKILRQTDTEIIEIDQQIKSEIKKGIIPDPATIDPITGEPLPPPDQSGMDQPMDQMPQDPNIDQQLPSAPSPKDVKKAEI